MTHTSYLYFTLFSAIMVFSPGPMTMLLMSIGAQYGFKRTMSAQFGASSAYLISLLIFTVGLTSILQHYDYVLKIIKYIGICYILYLAWKQWQNSKVNNKLDNAGNVASMELISVSKLYLRGLITGLSNPKTIIMFSTVIPQFVHDNSSKVVNLMILSAIFLILQFLSGLTYSYFGYSIKLFLQHEKYKKIIYRSIAILLIGIAIMIFQA